MLTPSITTVKNYNLASYRVGVKILTCDNLDELTFYVLSDEQSCEVK